MGSTFLPLPVKLPAVTAPLHERIRHARERAGLTQEQLADRVGVSLRTVGSWERGENHPRNKLAVLEDVLDVQLRESVGAAPQDAEPERLPVGTGVDPLDLTGLSPEDIGYLRGLAEGMRRRRGE